ncbi:MAG: hypothetical protein U5N86_11715, partial [Planctomycetota bacterium]|nr:hypothetical protein [Planctomycetota bacterium]
EALVLLASLPLAGRDGQREKCAVKALDIANTLFATLEELARFENYGELVRELRQLISRQKELQVFNTQVDRGKVRRMRRVTLLLATALLLLTFAPAGGESVDGSQLEARHRAFVKQFEAFSPGDSSALRTSTRKPTLSGHGFARSR